MNRSLLIFNLCFTFSFLNCSQQKIADVEADETVVINEMEAEVTDNETNPSSQDVMWEQECQDLGAHIWDETNNTCYPEYQTISDKEDCNSRPGYTWSAQSSACFPEYTTISNKEDCENRLGYSWSTLNEVCHPDYTIITSDVECDSISGYSWSEVHEACYPEYTTITSAEKCNGIAAYSWSDVNNACYPEYTTITSAEKCNSLSAYSWSAEDNACYPEYSIITSAEKCNSISAYSWSAEDNACYPEYSSITSAEKCNSVPGYAWSSEKSACYPKFSFITSAAECNSISGYVWNTSSNSCMEDLTVTAKEYCDSLTNHFWEQNQCVPRGGLTQSQAGESCKAILDNNFAVGDGVYWLDPNKGDTTDAFQAYCDMTTDGGGWLMVLNYVHANGTNPNLNVRTTAPPLLGSSALGADESASALYWGHAGNTLFTKLSAGATETRFYCKSANNASILHFKTSRASPMSYFRTGTGNMSGIAGDHTTFPDHVGFLPGGASHFFGNQGDKAMTEFPFYQHAGLHWAIRAYATAWLCDDPTGNGHSNTIHRIFIR